MPELVKALTARLFSSPLLAAESMIVLASLAVFLYQTPFIIAFVAIAACVLCINDLLCLPPALPTVQLY
jgi:hypothetical protein